MERFIEAGLDYIAEIKRPIQVAFSGGKDSTALVGLFLLAKQRGIPLDFEVVHANTLMEMPFLDVHVKAIQYLCEEAGVTFKFMTAPLKDRFLLNVIGRGVAIPNRNFRWCTDRLKIRPMEKGMRKGSVIVNGERLGESIKRDIKLKEVCGSPNKDCGVSEQSKIAEVFRPLLNWQACQVWDFIGLMDMENVLPDIFSPLSVIYSINQAENGSLRTGCIGCPLIKKDKSLNAFVLQNPLFAPLGEIKKIYERLVLPENRLVRSTTRSDKPQPGCIKLSSRKLAWLDLLAIEERLNNNGVEFQLVEPLERAAIVEALLTEVYPRGYSNTDEQVLLDISESHKIKLDNC